MYVNNVVRLLFPEFESLLVLLGRMGCWRGCRVRGEVGEDWREMLSALAPLHRQHPAQWGVLSPGRQHGSPK